ncbi:DUF4153 domain-containing protein [Flagellimonas meridianipacifica]|uniref:Uncharacterized protein DUF4173 n=1 Tax=Flagellimonas meridianipacifica TaxID=1080225 RepID=A0A2T0M8V6_9FLAO|nr:DUF4153 domain-containing protein [Allomuricauda pacifica]PRX53862.1 uncharacterized protein DUF4173 [Allomuricauda pacifica]
MNIHIKSILGALSFSVLLYSKSFGLNLVLLSIIVFLILLSVRKERPVPWPYICAYLFAAIMVFMDPTSYKIFIYFMCFFVLMGKSITSKASLYLSGLIGIVNMIIASILKFSEREKNPKKQEKRWSKRTTDTIKGILLAAIVLVPFTLLYQNANPIFSNLIGSINLSFISIPWLFFTLLGYICFLHIIAPYHPKELIKLDAQQSNDLNPPKEPFSIPTLEKLRSQQTLGSIIFLSLNVLLLFFLTTDFIYLYKSVEISNSGHSQAVHEGVYALMFSIVCAILIILYFFRGDLNFYKGNGRIKSLTYIWVALNIILVVFTWYKNHQYVEALGFTYKRIGVFVYLLLTLIGLITTYLKVAQVRSFIFLLRANSIVAFYCLIISASIPWDKAITWYNIEHIENPDLDYLIGLGNTNSQQLYHYSIENDALITSYQKQRIEEKAKTFITAQNERTWQEYTYYQLANSRQK